jgi:hypothetical protein
MLLLLLLLLLLQALMLMHQLLSGRNAVSDRFYRALYAVLLAEGARGAAGGWGFALYSWSCGWFACLHAAAAGWLREHGAALLQVGATHCLLCAVCCLCKLVCGNVVHACCCWLKEPDQQQVGWSSHVCSPTTVQLFCQCRTCMLLLADG